MNKQTGIIIGVIVLAFAAIAGVSIWQKNQPAPAQDYSGYELNVIKELSNQIDYSGYNLNTVLAADDASGQLAENVLGNPKADVVIFEYADYQCSYCALMNPYLEKIAEDYGDKIAIVFRSYVLDYHPNGVATASAANAAALQGFWPEYKKLLFQNQNEWYYLTGSKLQQQLEQYFETASNGKGNLEKFREDMKSEAVAKKIAFDRGVGEELNIGGTPWLYLDGKWIDNSRTDDPDKNLSPAEYAQRIRDLIDAKLAAKQ